MILQIWEMIYPALIILLSGFIGSLHFYIFLKLVSSGKGTVYSGMVVLTLSFLILPVVVIEMLSVFILNKGLISKRKPQNNLERIIIPLLFFPVLIGVVFIKPKKFVDGLSESLMSSPIIHEQIESKPVTLLREKKNIAILDMINRIVSAIASGKSKYFTMLKQH
ncbi:hypothetical protein [Metabacillus fastidiosus]|uniref:hypothetical protein n=1 Tax=Metabacillus fastidiosus TaxID=1458 RepID=UPI003D2BCD2A